MTEADEVSLEDLEAAAAMHDDLVAGTHLAKHEAAVEWLRNRPGGREAVLKSIGG